MAKQANKMMIGGFVVIAVVLLAASLVIFGSGKFFKKTVILEKNTEIDNLAGKSI